MAGRRRRGLEVERVVAVKDAGDGQGATPFEELGGVGLSSRGWSASFSFRSRGFRGFSAH